MSEPTFSTPPPIPVWNADFVFHAPILQGALDKFHQTAEDPRNFIKL